MWEVRLKEKYTSAHKYSVHKVAVTLVQNFQTKVSKNIVSHFARNSEINTQKNVKFRKKKFQTSIEIARNFFLRQLAVL
jgi:hypothetical protein